MELIQFLLLPIAEYLPQGSDGTAVLTALDPFEAFATSFKVALWASVVTCSPVILWQILAFFLPALKPKERKWFVPAFAAAVILFIVGTIFCYLIILNPAFQFLTGQVQGWAASLPRASTYVDTIVKFEIGFGFAFELPLLGGIAADGPHPPHEELFGQLGRPDAVVVGREVFLRGGGAVTVLFGIVTRIAGRGDGCREDAFLKGRHRKKGLKG